MVTFVLARMTCGSFLDWPALLPVGCLLSIAESPVFILDFPTNHTLPFHRRVPREQLPLAPHSRQTFRVHRLRSELQPAPAYHRHLSVRSTIGSTSVWLSLLASLLAARVVKVREHCNEASSLGRESEFHDQRWFDMGCQGTEGLHEASVFGGKQVIISCPRRSKTGLVSKQLYSMPLLLVVWVLGVRKRCNETWMVDRTSKIGDSIVFSRVRDICTSR